jgi:tRNA(adenine34) deaminase
MNTAASGLPALNDPSDLGFMRLALEQAQLAASMGEVPVGAVVVCAGAVVGRGHNRREIDADPSAHAEHRALIAASKTLKRWRLSGCTVYVTLEPCPMCAGLMQQARIDRCVFAAFDPKAGALGSLYQMHEDERLNHRFVVTGGVCEQESADLLHRFFARLRTREGGEGR